ncbi:LamB/YcsF family protein [Sabulicella rubraurantiaca]|uniref:LamB/YcsF family protein n=1 Tax=Sabulicella rubraurantiaca TaxID=2811429 RepID=UPI001A961863|nr:5-oxoprolinase subunit PxpA [Sabulicella rubraurantiaca]
MVTICLNADLGESFGPWQMGDDAALLPLIDSANLACGFHAGDPVIMAETVRMAMEAGTSIGAHPGFPDLQGFGRRAMRLSAREVEAMTAYQTGALAGAAALHGGKVTHVKPHGQLNTVASSDAAMARAIADAVRAVDPGLILVALPGTEIEKAARAAGLRCALEGYADRLYEPDGQLSPRSLPDAVHHDPIRIRDQALRLVLEGKVETRGGSRMRLDIQTICLHGDGPGAVAAARMVREGLEKAGAQLKPLPEMGL